MENRYIYEDLEIIHIKRKRIKNIYLSINRKQEIFVKTNISTSKAKVFELIKEKKEWIKKHLEKFDTIDKDVLDKKAIYFLGKKYKILKTNVPKPVVANMFDKIYIPINQDEESAIKDFYKSNILLLETILLKCIEKSNLKPSKVTYRYMKTRWGSCGIKNQISLNTQLLKFPEHLIEYVIYHELSHIVHKNHSKSFWDLVAKFVPEHKEYRLALRYY